MILEFNCLYLEKMIYNKWWRLGTKTCPKSDGDRSKASSLNVVNIGGVFVVLFCGLVFAVIVAIIEFCFKLRGDSRLHPSVKHKQQRRVGSQSSCWQRVINSVIPMFYAGDKSAKSTSDCSSCQSLGKVSN